MNAPMTKAEAKAISNVSELTNNLRTELLKNVDNIPAELKKIKGWLVWKVTEIKPNTGKFNKIPIYPRSINNRHGEQGGKADMANLGTWGEALEAVKVNQFIAGVGFALLPPFGVVALDVDHCVENGKLRENVEKLTDYTYCEISPSGTGVRAFWLGVAGDGKNHNSGYELFHSKGFVTITGNQVENGYFLCGDSISSLDTGMQCELEKLSRSNGKVGTSERSNLASSSNVDAFEMLPPQTIIDLRSALFYMPADDRDLWVKMGHSLKTLGDVGCDLWLKWSATSDKFDSQDAAKKWNSFKPSRTGYQAVFAAAKRMGWENPMSAAAIQSIKPSTAYSNSMNRAENGVPQYGDIKSMFNDVLLTDSHVQKMAEAEFLIPDMIVRGHVAAYVAPGNGGKTTLFLYLCEKLSSKNMEVIYVNVDGSPGDLKRHHAHAKKYGYKLVAPDACEGKSVMDVVGKLEAIAKGNERCDELVFIIDTLKKFVDVIDKRQAKSFYNLMRSLSVKGGTICLLGHCNKYKDDDGKAIYEGTADLRNDLDELIYLDSYLNEQKNELLITTRPDKVRADFSPTSYVIDLNNDRKVSEPGKVLNILSKEDQELVDLIAGAINDNKHSQKEIIEWVRGKTTVGDKKIRDRLIKHSQGDNSSFVSANTGRGKDLHYTLRDLFEEC